MPFSRDIAAAVRILRMGGLLALPTETVYGLAADATHELAVRSIFAVKGRPAAHPLIVHLADAVAMPEWADHVPPAAWDLAAAFWPGPLTLILPRGERAAPAVTGGLSTIGLRVPGHPLALELLRAFGGGVAAPSANRFGKVSPTCAEHVAEELGAAVPLILDGGPCAVGVESTILDLSGKEPCLLRPGAITATQLEQVLGHSLGSAAENETRCSGRLDSHYAPGAAVELVKEAELPARYHHWQQQGASVGILAEVCPAACSQAMFVPLSSDPAACAQRLYAALREGDRLGANILLVVPPQEQGLGIAIADRLAKAAAPRS